MSSDQNVTATFALVSRTALRGVGGARLGHGDSAPAGIACRHLLAPLRRGDGRHPDRHGCRRLDLHRLERRLHGHRHLHRHDEQRPDRHRDLRHDHGATRELLRQQRLRHEACGFLRLGRRLAHPRRRVSGDPELHTGQELRRQRAAFRVDRDQRGRLLQRHRDRERARVQHAGALHLHVQRPVHRTHRCRATSRGRHLQPRYRLQLHHQYAPLGRDPRHPGRPDRHGATRRQLLPAAAPSARGLWISTSRPTARNPRRRASGDPELHTGRRASPSTSRISRRSRSTRTAPSAPPRPRTGLAFNTPAHFTYTFSGHFHGKSSSGTERVGGQLREDVTFNDGTAYSCTTNTLPWDATRDTQGDQTATHHPPAATPAAAPSARGLWISTSRPTARTSKTSRFRPSRAAHRPRASPSTSRISRRSRSTRTGSFSATATENGLALSTPAQFTYTLGGHFHGKSSSGTERVGGQLREDVTFNDGTAYSCTTNTSPGTRPATPRATETATAPPAGSYSGSSAFGTRPVDFYVSADGSHIQDVALQAIPSCTPAKSFAVNEPHFASIAINADGSFSATATENGLAFSTPPVHLHPRRALPRQVVQRHRTRRRATTRGRHLQRRYRLQLHHQYAPLGRDPRHPGRPDRHGTTRRQLLRQQRLRHEACGFLRLGRRLAHPRRRASGHPELHTGQELRRQRAAFRVDRDQRGRLLQRHRDRERARVQHAGPVHLHPQRALPRQVVQRHRTRRRQLREDVTFNDGTAYSCTTNTLPWDATRDTQGDQTATAPPAGSYSGSSAFGTKSVSFTVAPGGTQLQNVTAGTAPTCTPSKSFPADQLHFASIAVNADRCSQRHHQPGRNGVRRRCAIHLHVQWALPRQVVQRHRTRRRATTRGRHLQRRHRLQLYHQYASLVSPGPLADIRRRLQLGHGR